MISVVFILPILFVGFILGILFSLWLGKKAETMRFPKPIAAQVLAKMTEELAAKEGQ